MENQDAALSQRLETLKGELHQAWLEGRELEIICISNPAFAELSHRPLEMGELSGLRLVQHPDTGRAVQVGFDRDLTGDDIMICVYSPVDAVTSYP